MVGVLDKIEAPETESLDSIPVMRESTTNSKTTTITVRGRRLEANFLNPYSITWNQEEHARSFESWGVLTAVRRYFWIHDHHYTPGEYSVSYEVNGEGIKLLKVKRL